MTIYLSYLYNCYEMFDVILITLTAIKSDNYNHNIKYSYIYNKVITPKCRSPNLKLIK